MGIRNNDFYKHAADSLMISDEDDKKSCGSFKLLTLHEGELVTFDFNGDSALVMVTVSTNINTDLITDTDWVAIHTNEHVGEIIDEFCKSNSNTTFSQAVKNKKPIECKHNAYRSAFRNNQTVSLSMFIKQLYSLTEDDIRSIVTTSCFGRTITLNDIMFWEGTKNV